MKGVSIGAKVLIGSSNKSHACSYLACCFEILEGEESLTAVHDFLEEDAVYLFIFTLGAEEVSELTMSA
jgi:hypothetical protein